ncbi:MAG TPA: helix-turn-helix domain-containing protein [Streptosporangiaceae bacterium]|jgi:DNA-binding transcriptional MerR regulator|nr:helix-turn-helix domain-containing protein [Streptosporangiaceae bacterium]
MVEVSIGEFARLSRLSPKALRLYDELGLLRPARVDPGTGYRWYETGQLERAGLIASLRQIQVPLARVGELLELDSAQAMADGVVAYWKDVEADHAARRDLTGYLVRRLTGDMADLYQVSTRRLPDRRLLCLKRNVDEAAAWALGREFVGLIRSRPLPRLPGRAGATFTIYWGEVSEDSDGPAEWCHPVPDDQAEAAAAGFPELTLRSEPAHEEAFVHLGDTMASPPRWQLLQQVLRGWVAQHGRQPGELAPRVTMLAVRPLTSHSVPDVDFAVPLA